MRPTKRLTHFLFDLDGTLIDSIELILASYRHTMVEHGRDIPSDDVWIRGLGTPLWDQLRSFALDDQEIDAMVATYRKHNLDQHDTLVREYPGVRDTVTELSQRALTLGIVTSKLRDTAYRGLRICGYDTEMFATLVGADDVTEHKPKPAPILAAMSQVGGHGSTIYVGDSPHDIQAGTAAGVLTAAVGWGPFPRADLEAAKPDYWIESPVELLELAA